MSDGNPDTDPARAMCRHRTDALVDDRGDGPALLCLHGSLMDRTMFAPQARALDLPALAVHGEQDQSIPPERARHTAEALDGRLELVEGAGHPSNLERPGAVNDALREFLTEVY